MAILIKSNGEFIDVFPKDGVSFQLDELQKYVGGYIEIIHHPKEDMIAVVNEEGRLLELPYNPYASLIFGREIVGDVVSCDSSKVL